MSKVRVQSADETPGLPRLAAANGHMSPLERLRRLVVLEKDDVGVIAAYAVSIGLVSLAVPIAAQSLVNTVGSTALLQPIVVLSLLVLVGLFVAAGLRALQYRVVETLQQRFFVRAIREAMSRLVRVDVRAFDEDAPSEVMNRFFDVALIQKTASTLLLDALSVVLQGGLSLVLLAFYHPALLAFDVVLVLSICFVLFGISRGGIESAIAESKAKYKTAAWLEEVAGGFRAYKPEDGAAFALERSEALARSYVLARRRHFRVLFRQFVAAHGLQALGSATLLGLGGALVIQGELTLGQLVAAELIVTSLLAGVAKLGKYLENYYDLVASLDKLGVILDLPPERLDGIHRDSRSGPAHLSVENVAFSYDGTKETLKNVSFEIRPAARLAILGANTSGKSTLLEVLYAFRSQTRGVIRLDGVDTRTLKLSQYRRDVALVGAPEVFDGTLIENLCFGRQNIDIQDCQEVLRAVDLADDVDQLPEGAMTQVGPHGRNLTSSQSTRLMIARALLARPSLLILDEALDGLGLETACRVLAGLLEASHKTTLLVLTSREEIAEAVGPKMRLDHGVLSSLNGQEGGVA
jgi:putative ABC transport system ATP-binding protein